DLYLSTRDALAFIAPRLVSGGVIVFDDYGGYDSPGVTKAVNELLEDTSVRTRKSGSAFCSANNLRRKPFTDATNTVLHPAARPAFISTMPSPIKKVS